MPRPPGANKRQRERQQDERRKQKENKREQRRQDKTDRKSGDGYDPFTIVEREMPPTD